ncbi:hypothetical protein ACVWYG_000002 [Pedobacter sp. UYEF25]
MDACIIMAELLYVISSQLTKFIRADKFLLLCHYNTNSPIVMRHPMTDSANIKMTDNGKDKGR